MIDVLLKRFEEVRIGSEKICSDLAKEDYSIQPTEFVSPPKWHLAHTTWFFEEFILSVYQTNYKRFNEDFAYYFNSYYNNVGDRVLRVNRGLLSRPTIDKVLEYRAYVTKAILEFFLLEQPKEIADLLEIGIHHEEQHQELLYYDIKYILGNQAAQPKFELEPSLNSIEKTNKYIKVAEGIYTVGSDGTEFAYDNELGQHKTYVHAFEIASDLVTNGDWIEFIKDGGYNNFNLWHSDGWTWKNENNVEAPLYWFKQNNQWKFYNYKGLENIDESLPVCNISYYEAFAFAQWRGMRLPTEFEWEAAADQLEWGQVWEWTESAYLPYPGFKKAPGALGEYNGKFMVNQKVLKGASFATSKNHSRKTYRNFFHPDMRWQFAGLRLVKQ